MCIENSATNDGDGNDEMRYVLSNVYQSLEINMSMGSWSA
jgi:hypothetical protein